MLICELSSGKLYDLGLAGFPVGSPLVTEKVVPTYEPTCAVSEHRAKSPLRSYFNPCRQCQSRSFPPQQHFDLSLFCSYGFIQGCTIGPVETS